MSISIPWALALIGSGVTSALLLFAWKRRAAGRIALLDSMLHLLAGGLAGFLAIAFYPGWPLLAAIIGMLTIRAAQASRLTDVGLLATGFGAVWTAMIGSGLINDRLDPGVVAPDRSIPFAIAVALLTLGIVLAIGAEPDVSPSR
jgi:hypothetical protein